MGKRVMKTIPFFCIIFLFACGCRKSSGNKDINSTDIFPGKVGDTWLYLVNDTTVNGQDSSAAEYNMTIAVTDSIQLPGGIQANVWVYQSPMGKDTNYVFQTGDTVRFLDRTKSYTVRQYIIPLSLQNSWPYIFPGINVVTVVAQADILVGGVRYDNAFHIYGNAGMPDGTFSIDEWIGNNVGVVKRYLDPYGELLSLKHVIAWSLVSYQLK
jgi:hypothetical protein